MEETSSSLKRQREEETQEVVEEHYQEEEVYKRQKSYKDIITLLEEEEDEPNEDLSSLISTLQEEISSSGSVEPGLGDSDPVQSGSGSYESGSDEGVEEVMKHLLEASDDELGIPSSSNNSSSTEMDGFDVLVEGQVDGGDLLFSPVGGEGLWEFENHEAANYYNNFLQSEIFM